MLGFILYIFALIFVQGFTAYLASSGDAIDESTHDEIFRLFGSVQIAVLTLFSATTGGTDWETAFEQVRKAGGAYAACYIFYVGFFQFAVFNILTGLFVEHATKMAKPDNDSLIFEQRTQEMQDVEEMKALFRGFDRDGDGQITMKELREALTGEREKATLALHGLDVKDAEVFFNLVSEALESEAVNVDSFAESALRIKGYANAMDVQTLLFKSKINAQRSEAMSAEILKQLSQMTVVSAHATHVMDKALALASAQAMAVRPAHDAGYQCTKGVADGIDLMVTVDPGDVGPDTAAWNKMVPLECVAAGDALPMPQPSLQTSTIGVQTPPEWLVMLSHPSHKESLPNGGPSACGSERVLEVILAPRPHVQESDLEIHQAVERLSSQQMPMPTRLLVRPQEPCAAAVPMPVSQHRARPPTGGEPVFPSLMDSLEMGTRPPSFVEVQSRQHAQSPGRNADRGRGPDRREQQPSHQGDFADDGLGGGIGFPAPQLTRPPQEQNPTPAPQAKYCCGPRPR
eukprot:gnl/TRDRNA2_/TRDRNA2_87346_c0_seq1.p1 gnl/TRDRNA2_/TRDRNA2_87346_c0~~gnl/TRDRNA2_/TRDRNA2_87346_c0_seq1.p1  ORF type:complete len:516 (+),score=89.54 gnl/TRDRNA2_/TRDRNA2_87346_c0_seq1:2-1549(+)